MKRLARLCAILALFQLGSAAAQSGGMKDMDMKSEKSAPKAPVKSHHATGVVKSVNAEKGTVSIEHGPVSSLKWAAMTMSFKAKDKKALQALKPGQKIEFDFEQHGKDYVITKVK